ncbi:uncharacterized protein LOC135122903 isoform X2 [Zophobas morio]|uniref:uncharacterized protein LOC135122903 isoform X2 n=1 Tax=Zophobas morio TaxID=2755281 RepID=UPI0030829AB2
MILPKGCKERKRIIDTIRKMGNFSYNQTQKSTGIIVCRRKKNLEISKRIYSVCPNCKGYFVTSAIRKHFKNCAGKNDKKKGILVMSRKLDIDVHQKASDILKYKVLPVMRLDSVCTVVRNDAFLITYGNKLCSKYRSPHMYKMIRTRLRLLGTFFLEMNKLQNNIQCFADIFDPIYYEHTVKAINTIARLDAESGKYGAPSTAFNLGILIKHCATLYIAQCIQNSCWEKKTNAENYLKVLTEDIGISVNKTVIENQKEFKRKKKILLPQNNDIKILSSFLTKNRRNHYNNLKNVGFKYDDWLNLASYTLISLQLFNRRRAGEIERVLITDFLNFQSVDEVQDKEIYDALSEESKTVAKKYVRFEARGKLGRGVPVLIHRELLQSIEYILNNRKKAGVMEKNPYLFGIPGNESTHLSACQLMRKFSQACGAKNPTLLRGTTLRKHIATRSATMNLQESDVSDLANFMGHAEKIHREHYKLPIVTREITKMAQILEKAEGKTAKDNEKLGSKDTPNCVVLLEKLQQENIFSEKDTGNLLDRLETDDDKLHAVLPDQPQPGCSKYYISDEEDDSVVVQSRTNGLLFVCFVTLYFVVIYLAGRGGIKARKSKTTRKIDSTPTKKPHVRIAWVTPERHAVKSAFQTHIDQGTLPSFQECREAQMKFPVLQRRNLATIKTKISNEIRRRKLRFQ